MSRDAGAMRGVIRAGRIRAIRADSELEALPVIVQTNDRTALGAPIWGYLRVFAGDGQVYVHRLVRRADAGALDLVSAADVKEARE